jgi:hypothetical protein
MSRRGRAPFWAPYTKKTVPLRPPSTRGRGPWVKSPHSSARPARPACTDSLRGEPGCDNLRAWTIASLGTKTSRRIAWWRPRTIRVEPASRRDLLAGRCDSCAIVALSTSGVVSDAFWGLVGLFFLMAVVLLSGYLAGLQQTRGCSGMAGGLGERTVSTHLATDPAPNR